MAYVYETSRVNGFPPGLDPAPGGASLLSLIFAVPITVSAPTFHIAPSLALLKNYLRGDRSVKNRLNSVIYCPSPVLALRSLPRIRFSAA